MTHRRRRVGFAPEGAPILIVSGALVVIAVAVSLLVGHEGKLLWLPALTVIWFFLAAQFFRDPERIPPEGGGLILSPADGKVISVGEALECPWSPKDPRLHGNDGGTRISIFMSPVNVHVNRSPVAGMISLLEHKPGKFLSAFKPAASRENEQTVIILETPYGPVAFKQIAGFLARRIVFHPKTGESLVAGQRVGMIRFGSRVDVFLPESVSIKVRTGQMVTAGETILGEFIEV